MERDPTKHITVPKPGIRENITLLIVEDDRAYRTLAAESLQKVENYTIRRLLADTAKSGLNIFRHENPDITFLDIMLPDGSGLDLLSACLQYDPQAFIVMMTSSADAKDVYRAKEIGAKGYILKPFNVQKVKDVMTVYEMHNNPFRPEKMEEWAAMECDMESLFDITEPKQGQSSIEDIIADWNILFADDYLTNCDNAKRNLAKFRCNVKTTTNGKEALALIQEKHFELMFLDTNLPDIDGYQLAMSVRSKDRDDAIKSYLIGMMRNLDEAEKKRWLQVGMNDFLIKPCTFAALEKILLKYAKRYKSDLSDTFFS